MKLSYRKYQNIATSLGLLIASVALASTITGSLSTGFGDNGGVGGVVVTTPSASPAAATFTANQSVTLTATGSNSIHYTTDGTTPTCTSGSTYSTAISVTTTTTIKALACYANSNASSVLSSLYTLQCTTTSVTNGSVAAYPTCTITCNSGYTLSGSTCVSSGGGSGGGGFSPGYSSASTTPTTAVTTTTTTTNNLTNITYLKSVIAQLQARLTTLLAQMQSSSSSVTTTSVPVASDITPVFSFTIDLELGVVSDSVRQLQVYLNNHGFRVASTGPGSPGNETNKFGVATRNALKLFQKSVNISASGFFGPTTRAYVNSH
ncbi:MAG: peptidoglycan-binding domain-containing protein [bacterium]